ncbi:hypothetical protein Tco_0500047 [Tanacetum coccineum]
MAKLRKDILMFQQRQDESLYDAWTRFKDLLQKVPHHGLDLWLQVQIFYDHVDYTTQMAIDYAAGGRLRKLRPEEAWETIEDLAQHEEEEWNDPIFSKKGSPDYIDATLEQELESMECRVESLMRNEVLLEYEEDQVRQLEEDMRKTKDTFMCLADSLIATLKVEIETKRVHSTKIEKITRFPTHTLTVTPKTLKPVMVHRVSMISNIKPTIYRTPHQHLNSNLKMPILHSFEENKLEYENEDEVEIKMMGTRMDTESLEHNLYENVITPIICHNFSPTSNPPNKPKNSGSFRMKVIFDEQKLGRYKRLKTKQKRLGLSIYPKCHVAHSGGATWRPDPTQTLTRPDLDPPLTSGQPPLTGGSPPLTGGSGDGAGHDGCGSHVPRDTTQVWLSGPRKQFLEAHVAAPGWRIGNVAAVIWQVQG